MCGTPISLIGLISAPELGLSTESVDAHRYQISQRLQVHEVAGMVRYAIRHGLVQNIE